MGIGKIVDLSGERYGRLVVTGGYDRRGRVSYWNCTCDCGKTLWVIAHSLRSGNTKSCGCLFMDQARARKTKHGKIDHPIYQSWRAMRRRCTLPTDTSYAGYGGRGISVCERWQKFENFWEDMSKTWREGTSIDRLDNDKGYEPGNCKWSTPFDQAQNRRTAVMINTKFGPMSVTRAAEAFNIKRNTIYSRIRYGWAEEDLLK